MGETDAADLDDDNASEPKGMEDLIKELKAAMDYNNRLDKAFKSYAPRADTTGAPPHADMGQAASAFATLARFYYLSTFYGINQSRSTYCWI